MSASLVIEGTIARLTLERPQALNALNRAVAEALESALGQLERSKSVSVVIVSGRGRAFCAGNDIAEMPTLGPAEARALSRRWQKIMDRFARLPQVTIAAVRGYALGGGCMLAAAQDLRVAEASARFGLPEVTLGFNPSYGIARILDVVGGGPARDLLLTGRPVDAAEALRMGLVTRVGGHHRRAGRGHRAAPARRAGRHQGHRGGYPRGQVGGRRAGLRRLLAPRPGRPRAHRRLRGEAKEGLTSSC